MEKQLRSRSVPASQNGVANGVSKHDEVNVTAEHNGTLSSNGTMQNRMHETFKNGTHKAENGTHGKFENGTHKIENGVHAKLENGSVYSNQQAYFEQKFSEGKVAKLLNRTILPLLLIVFIPNLVMALWYTAEKCNGSYLRFLSIFENSVVAGLRQLWAGSYLKEDGLIPAIFVGYVLYCVATMVLIPGKRFNGPMTVMGNTPSYKDNGFYCYVLTMLLFAGMTYYLKLHGMTPTVLYDRFNEFLFFINAFSLSFCVFLYLKGRYFPSSSDGGLSGNIFFDYYWGTELYPRICGIDVKVLINCRYGMTIWPLLVIIFTMKCYELHGFVDSAFISAFLQLFYITKFFWWESGYMKTLDIILDRAGFYICWGCLVYIPSLYTYVSMYLVKNPVHLGPVWSSVILAVGLLSICINYLVDAQKLEVRELDGNCCIWGKKAEIIRAEYRLATGETRANLLLVSGWWGVARHFNYFLELILALAWTLPTGFSNLAPYTYFIFLLTLLIHRTFRDEEKCSEKYGKYWKEYCQRVPYRIVPYLF